MTIHPVRMNGTIIAVPQAFEYLAKIQERIVDFITSHSHITAERLQQLMRETGQLTADVGTVISGNQAAALGLIDEVGTLSDALEALYTMIGEHKTQKETVNNRLSVCQKVRLAFCVSCGSTHKIEFAKQIHKFREHGPGHPLLPLCGNSPCVSRNLYKGRKNVARQGAVFLRFRSKAWFRARGCSENVSFFDSLRDGK